MTVGCLWGVALPAVVAIGTIVIDALYDITKGGLGTNGSEMSGLAVAVVAFCLFIALVGAAWYLLPIHHRETHVGYGYECELCGKLWNEYFDQPKPAVTVRPDLIRQGEERLQKEADARQRYMEAAWWDEQQRKQQR